MLFRVAPIIGLAIGYRLIIGIVMHIGISGVFPYQFFLDFFWIFLDFFDFVVFYKHGLLRCSAHK